VTSTWNHVQEVPYPRRGDRPFKPKPENQLKICRQREHHGRPKHPQAESFVLQNRALISKRQARQHQCPSAATGAKAEQQADPSLIKFIANDLER